MSWETPQEWAAQQRKRSADKLRKLIALYNDAGVSEGEKSAIREEVRHSNEQVLNDAWIISQERGGEWVPVTVAVPDGGTELVDVRYSDGCLDVRRPSGDRSPISPPSPFPFGGRR